MKEFDSALRHRTSQCKLPVSLPCLFAGSCWHFHENIPIWLFFKVIPEKKGVCCQAWLGNWYRARPRSCLTVKRDSTIWGSRSQHGTRKAEPDPICGPASRGEPTAAAAGSRWTDSWGSGAAGGSPGRLSGTRLRRRELWKPARVVQPALRGRCPEAWRRAAALGLRDGSSRRREGPCWGPRAREGPEEGKYRTTFAMIKSKNQAWQDQTNQLQ